MKNTKIRIHLESPMNSDFAFLLPIRTDSVSRVMSYLRTDRISQTLHPSILALRRRKALCHPSSIYRANTAFATRYGVLHRVGFTVASCYHNAGELLPRLSILTLKTRRFISVALSRESPPADVISYPAL